jgi:hypothetical protein
MLFRIVIEIALGVGMLRAASTFWQFQKRKRYWKEAMQNPTLLASLISRERLEDPPRDVLFFARTPKKEVGYIWNVKCLMDSDKNAVRRCTIFYLIAIAAILVGSYFLGVVYFVINAVLMLLTTFVPISTETKSDAALSIFALGLILHKWRLNSAAECDQFIEQARGFRVLYEVVKRQPNAPTTANTTPPSAPIKAPKVPVIPPGTLHVRVDGRDYPLFHDPKGNRAYYKDGHYVPLPPPAQ